MNQVYLSDLEDDQQKDPINRLASSKESTLNGKAQNQNDALLELIQKEYLYEIDFNKETFQKRMNFQLKQYHDIVRYYYSNKLCALDFQQGVRINNEMLISGKELKQKFTLILRNTIKRLQQYLSNVYQKKIVCLSNSDLRYLYQIIMSKPEILSQQHVNTLSRTMKMAFDLPVKMQESELVELYSHLLYLIQERHSSRNIERRLLFKNESSLSINSKQIERDICSQYLIEHNTNRIRQNILEKYESNEELKQYKQVDFYFIMERIFRKAFLKLKHEYSKYDKDYQCPLNLKQRQYIYLIRSKQALPFRLALIAFFKEDFIFLRDIYKIIELMKSLLQDRAKTQDRQIKITRRSGKSDQVDLVTSQEDIITTRRRKRANFIESEGQNLESDKEQSNVYQPQLYKKKQSLQDKKKQLTLSQSYIRSGKKVHSTNQFQSQRKEKREGNSYMLDNYQSS